MKHRTYAGGDTGLRKVGEYPGLAIALAAKPNPDRNAAASRGEQPKPKKPEK